MIERMKERIIIKYTRIYFCNRKKENEIRSLKNKKQTVQKRNLKN